MPIFSLPDGPGIGDFGPGAYRFVDFLEAAGQTIWQLLPLGPPAKGDSPYSSYSAFAGNPLLISCELLVTAGLLNENQLSRAGYREVPNGLADYDNARFIRQPLLRAAWSAFRSSADPDLWGKYSEFCEQNWFWLPDFARFDVLATEHGDLDWSGWDIELIHCDPSALAAVDRRLSEEIEFVKFQQFLFAGQWKQLKEYANRRSVRIYGDMPIFIAHESADVWKNQELFYLDEAGRSLVVAGVPPDYFSCTGQMWGNPLYRWDQMAATNYGWWTQRFAQALEYFDILRLDHFRGFEAYWQIPADAENAATGQWMPGPRCGPFLAAREALGELPIVAEDLGLITEGVHALRDQLGFPGMRVLQFGFVNEDDVYHRPDTYPAHSVAYTGTHDNDTVIGWYHQRIHQNVSDDFLNRCLSQQPDQVHFDLIRLVLNSAADTAIIPMQDLLGLGSETRTNTPGKPDGNWRWRCPVPFLTEELAGELRSMTKSAGRI